MQQTFQQEAEKYTKSNRGRRIWQRFVRVMAGFVVFCTTYALILPAITMEQETFCGLEEHKHSEACYIQPTRPTELICTPDQIEVHVHTDACLDASGNQVCGQADYIVHTHDTGCYDVAGKLACTFTEKVKHVHAGGCYAPVELPADSHTHIDTCYNKVKGNLTCGSAEQEAHSHSDACYAAEATQICGLNETEGHAHGEGCVDAEGNLICTTEESTAHAHSDGCYEKAMTCGLNEQEAHTHTDGCYAWKQEAICGLEETPIPEPQLICTEPVAQEHIHGDGCFVTAKEQPLTCGLEETPATEATEATEATDATEATAAAEATEAAEPHTHTFLCYGVWELICPTQEHTHSLACFSDPEADVETEEDWKKTLPEELTGVYVDDLLAAAESQLGYTESEKNYTVLEDGETKQGYTRYGQWYGDPYGQWDDMYASFCIYYAGGNALEALEGFPLESDTAKWVEKLEEGERFLKAGDGTPEPGDLAFFDTDEDGIADHAAIVIELFEEEEEGEKIAKLRVYEGDVEDQVQKNKYELADPAILGYGLLPEVPDYDPVTGEVPVNVYTYSDDTLQVEVVLPVDSAVPADAVLTVRPILSEEESYEGYVLRAEEAVDGTVGNILLYDISFYTAEGDYIPVGENARVSMQFAEPVVDPAANIQVLHFAEDDGIPEVISDVNVEEKEVSIAVPAGEAPAGETPADATEPVEVVYDFSHSRDALSGVVEPAAAEDPVETEAAETEPAETEATEPAAEPVREVRTVIEFKTPGFSTFAVVEVKTAQYSEPILDYSNVTNILSHGQLTSIGDYTGLTVMISTYNPDGDGNDTNDYKALTSTVVNTNYLDDQAVAQDENKTTVTVNGGVKNEYLWKFANRTEDGGNYKYKIQSVDEETYLTLGGNPADRVGLADDGSDIFVVPQANTSPLVRLALQNNLGGRELALNNELDHFSAYNNSGNGSDQLVLSVPTLATKVLGGDGVSYNVAGNDYPLDGRVIAISRSEAVNNNVHRALTAVDAGTVAPTGLKAFDVTMNGDTVYASENTLWLFTKADAKNTYYIQAYDPVTKTAGKYLQMNGGNNIATIDNGIGVDTCKIQVVDGETDDTISLFNDVYDRYLSIVFESNGQEFVQEYRFTGYGNRAGENNNPRGDLILSAVDMTPPQTVVTNLDGQSLAIVSVRDTMNAQNQPDPIYVVTAEEGTETNGNNTVTGRKGVLLGDAQLEIAESISTITNTEIPANGYWTFEAVDAGVANGQYYIKSSGGQYLKITAGGAELVAEAQREPILVTTKKDDQDNDVILLSVPDTNIYLNRYWGTNRTAYVGYNNAGAMGDVGSYFVLARPYGFKATVLSREELRRVALMPNAQLIFFVRQTDANGNARYYAVNVDGTAEEIYLESDNLADNAVVYTTTTDANIRWDATGSTVPEGNGNGWHNNNVVNEWIDLWPKNLGDPTKILCPNWENGGNPDGTLGEQYASITSGIDPGTWDDSPNAGSPIRGKHNPGLYYVANPGNTGINQDIASLIGSELDHQNDPSNHDGQPDIRRYMLRYDAQTQKFAVKAGWNGNNVGDAGMPNIQATDDIAFYVAMVDTTGLLPEVQSDKHNLVAQIMTRGEFMDAASEYSADYPFIIFASDGTNYYAMDAYGKAQPINYVRLPEDGTGETYWEAGDKLIFQIEDATPMQGDTAYNANRVLWDASATQYQPPDAAEDFKTDNWIDLWLCNKATGMYLNPGPNGLTIGGRPDDGVHNPGFYRVAARSEGDKDPDDIASYLASRLDNPAGGELRYHVELDSAAGEFKVVDGWSDTNANGGGTLGKMDGDNPNLVFYIAMLVDWNVAYDSNAKTVSEYEFVNPVTENVEMHLFNYGSAIDFYGATFNNTAENYPFVEKISAADNQVNDGDDSHVYRAVEDGSNLLYRFFHRIPFHGEAVDGTNEANSQYIREDPTDGAKYGGNRIVYQRVLSEAGYPLVDLKDSTDGNAEAPQLDGTYSLQYLFDKSRDFVTEDENLTLYMTGNNDVNDGIEKIDAPDNGSDIQINKNGTTSPAGSYDPIVNPNYAVKHFRVGKTYADGSTSTGLFRRDDKGYFYYNGAKNAAWFEEGDGNTGIMHLQKYTIFPAGANDDEGGNYLPFNVGHTDGRLTNTAKANSYNTRQYTLNGFTEEDNPVTGRPSQTDLWFGMTLEFEFEMTADGAVARKNDQGQYLNAEGDIVTNIEEAQRLPMEFDFSGDDDVLVYIDDVLILDIGGIHPVSNGNINFQTGVYKDIRGEGTIAEQFERAGVKGDLNVSTLAAGTHTLKFFYMERGGNISDCSISFNLEPKEKGGLSVTKEIEGLGLDDAANYDAEFTFQLIDIVQPYDVNNKEGVWEVPYTIDRADGTQDGGLLQLHKETVPANASGNGSGHELDICRYYLPADDPSKDDDIYDQVMDFLGDQVEEDSEGKKYIYIYRYYGIVDENGVKSDPHFFYYLNGVYTESNNIIDGTGNFYVVGKSDPFTLGAYDTVEFKGLIVGTKLKVKEMDTKNGVELGTSYWWKITDTDTGSTLEGSSIGVTDDAGNHISNEFWIENETAVSIRCRNMLSPVRFGIRKELYDYDGTTLSNDTTTEFEIKYTIDYPDSDYLVEKVETVNEKSVTKLYEAVVDPMTGEVLSLDAAGNAVKPDSEGNYYQVDLENGGFKKNADGALIPAAEGDLKGTMTEETPLREYQTNTWTLTNQGEYGEIVDTKTGLDGNDFVARNDAEDPVVPVETVAPDVTDYIWTVNVPFGSVVTIEEITVDGYDVTWEYEGWDIAGQTEDTDLGTYQKIYEDSGSGAETTGGIKLLATDNYFTIKNTPVPDITVTKSVENLDGTEYEGSSKFSFDYELTVPGEEEPRTGSFAIDIVNGKAGSYVFKDVPKGSVIKITETNGDGYMTTYRIGTVYEAESGKLSDGAKLAGNGLEVVDLGTVEIPVKTAAKDELWIHYNAGADGKLTANSQEVDCPAAGTLAKAGAVSGDAVTLRNAGGTALSVDYIEIVGAVKGGNSVTTEGIQNPITIHFTNTAGYELPNSGGTGTYLYTAGGVLLMMAALALLLYYHTKRGKEDYASS